MKIMSEGQPTLAGKYFHWDQLRHRTPPQDLSSEEWWMGIKMSRRQTYHHLPLRDVSNAPFVYCLTDAAFKFLHHLDSHARGHIAIEEVVTNPESRTRYVVSSLIEEAITSSQLEGASTTRKVAAEMLRSGRKPQDRSEQMIVNNYLAMEHIQTMLGDKLTPDRVFELHRILARNTLDTPDAAGRLQRPDEKRVRVYDDRDNTTLHVPPPAEQLPDRLAAMCAFANGKKDSEDFIHPVIRAITLHFWLAYDHPFEDGNGRTARALFYWAMLKAGYWLFEYVSISSLLRKGPAEYSRAFLYTETDDNDLTYFLLHQLNIMRRSMDELYTYLNRKVQEVKKLERSIRDVEEFNYRQRALLAHALRHPDFKYTIQSHKRSHNVAYATARSDLQDLASKGLLVQSRIGRKMVFLVPENLHRQINAA